MTLCVDVVVARGQFELRVCERVEPGEVIAVLGPNGSGKTSLLRAVAGLDPIDSGSVTLDGHLLDDPASEVFVPPERRPIGTVFQQYLLFDHLTALDNVAFGHRARGVPRREARRRAAAWLERVGLSDVGDAFPTTLSGGQSQRVALARVLTLDPQVVLLDEPLAALDPGTRRDTRRELRRHLTDFTGACIVVSHDPVDAYALADRIVVLDAGHVAQVGTIAEITAHPRSRYVADLIGTNLLTGTVGPDGFVTDDGTLISVVADFVGPAFALVRPRSITVAATATDTSARNTIGGTVDDIDRIGDRVRVGIRSPGTLHLTAEITGAALDSLDLRPGGAVFAVVKATDIDVYPM